MGLVPSCHTETVSHPPLEGEGRSRAARAGWGDSLSPPNTARVERSPHPGASRRPSPSRGG
ncbi:hypothetical protein EOW77_0035650 [Bradyrhizobium yuanmingense]|nr:hypothetical protein EOW77_0035650 [Bradyrhizobium yuanmingense]